MNKWYIQEMIGLIHSILYIQEGPGLLYSNNVSMIHIYCIVHDFRILLLKKVNKRNISTLEYHRFFLSYTYLIFFFYIQI